MRLRFKANSRSSLNFVQIRYFRSTLVVQISDTNISFFSKAFTFYCFLLKMDLPASSSSML